MAADSDPERVGEILREWHNRRLAGERADPAELVRAHPECAAELQQRLDALGALDLVFDMPAATVPATIGEFRIEREIGRH